LWLGLDLNREQAHEQSVFEQPQSHRPVIFPTIVLAEILLGAVSSDA